MAPGSRKPTDEDPPRANRIDAAGGIPEMCVLHYKPSYSLYPGYAPTYYAAVTDAYIIYPWELDRGPEVLGAWN